MQFYSSEGLTVDELAEELVEKLEFFKADLANPKQNNSSLFLFLTLL